MAWSQYATTNATTQSALTPPPVPTGLTATAGSDRVVLRWTASAGATGYVVEKRVGVTWSEIHSGQGVTATATVLTPDTDYGFRVKAVNAEGTSGWTTVEARTRTETGFVRIIRFSRIEVGTPETTNVIKGG